MKKISFLVTSCFLLMMFSLGCFILAELVYRSITGPDETALSSVMDNSNLPAPYVVFRNESTSKSDTDEVFYNELGYRGDMPSKIKIKKQVFILGGSTVEGFNLPKRIQRRLKIDYKLDVEVHNFGVASSMTMQDLNRLIIDLYEYNPDLIIFYGGGNEIQTPDLRIGYPHRYLVIENNPLWITPEKPYPILDLILFSSKILRDNYTDYFREKFFKEHETNRKELAKYKNTKEIWKKKADFYLRNLEVSNLISTKMGANFLAVLQPLEANYDKTNQRVDIDVFFQDYVLNEYTNKYQNEFKLLDLKTALNKLEKNPFLDPVHINNEGNEKIADEIAKYINKMKLLK